ncbi:MAG: hypothetical protein HUJ25_11005 [Crocinitomicaceae bacterium]|nr:hypothetical protein [Crocinitomicaceae bacterium]
MKALIKRLLTVCLGLLFILSTSASCHVHIRHDRGKHKGWYKNPKNPHHPRSNNPGHKKHKKKKKKKERSMLKDQVYVVSPSSFDQNSI